MRPLEYKAGMLTSIVINHELLSHLFTYHKLPLFFIPTLKVQWYKMASQSPIIQFILGIKHQEDQIKPDRRVQK